MSEPRLKHETVKVRDLIQDHHNGRLVIPEFQRPYVWRKGKAPKLMDSLYRGFPISSLLVWENSSPVRSRQKNPRAANTRVANWLIDGQQRVITLAKAFNGDEGIDVVFNPRSPEFRLRNAVIGRKPTEWFKLADIWNDEAYRRIRKNFDGADASDGKRENHLEAVRRILDYEVPVVRMIGHSLKDAVDAFKRINTYGVKLGEKDIQSADIAARHSGFVADNVVPFLESLAARGFGRLNIMHLFRACAFIAMPDGRKRTPLHDLGANEVLAAWQKTERATAHAIRLIQAELGLTNMDILWSGALMVPIIVLCATVPAQRLPTRELVGWLALAVLMHRYSGSAGSALEQDLRRCRDDDPIGGLLNNLRQRRPGLAARPEDFRGALGDRSGLLALFIACRHRGAADFYTGEKIGSQPDLDRHHLLARAQFEQEERARADTLANISLIIPGANRSLGSKGPEVYLKELSSRVRKGHCIPDDSALWAVSRAEDFWAARRKLLAAAFNDFVHHALPGRRLGV